LFRERCQSRSRSRHEKQKAGVETVENERASANSILKGVCFLGLHNWSRERTTTLLREHAKSIPEEMSTRQRRREKEKVDGKI
ncbi:unnamed protein product, partial [Brassica oleracea var. botrytis]